ncbi:hypothetical protein RRG08_052843 [Elysia crispata]|uniref:Uncharacterized protein n=1 Tax=Elysia crispata TaxID=231223 RepID=A0AAE1BB19_9GAST|nr:hypothetical protein RRG08_052843 [Elysia crispata]
MSRTRQFRGSKGKRGIVRARSIWTRARELITCSVEPSSSHVANAGGAVGVLGVVGSTVAASCSQCWWSSRRSWCGRFNSCGLL